MVAVDIANWNVARRLEKARGKRLVMWLKDLDHPPHEFVLNAETQYAAAHNEAGKIAANDDRGPDQTLIAIPVRNFYREHKGFRVLSERTELRHRKLAAGRIKLGCALEKLLDAVEFGRPGHPLDAAFDLQRGAVLALVEGLGAQLLAAELRLDQLRARSRLFGQTGQL